jgi:hypothetical protein
LGWGVLHGKKNEKPKVPILFSGKFTDKIDKRC